MLVRLLLLSVLTAAACGPEYVPPVVDHDGGDGGHDDARPDATPDAYGGELAVITGRVWAPNLAPGLTAPGEEIPIADASIYVSVNRPPEIPDHVYCERCSARPRSAVQSAADGSFELMAPPGTWWLVIEKGQFRYERQVTLAPGPLELSALETTLPSTHDPEQGLWIPNIAIAIGTHDWIEDVLGKIRLGSVDENNRYTATNGDVDAYDNGSPTVEVHGTLNTLLGDLALMRKYHIILLPCSDEAGVDLHNHTIQENIRRYVNEGGKLYVTDFSGRIVDTPFPTQITFGQGDRDPGADTTGAYDPADPAVSDVEAYGNTRGFNYISPDAEIADPLMNEWLGLQSGPAPLQSTTQRYNPDSFFVMDNNNFMSKLTPVRLGVDRDGNEVFDTPKVWVKGSGRIDDVVKLPLAVTFEPTGCGRVMYSTYHTTGGAHPGLLPQERVLLYLIFELGTCQQGPIIE